MQAIVALSRADFLEQLVEGIFFPVVRGQDGDTAAPHKQGKGRLHKLRQIVHKGRLVDDDAPLFGTKGAGFGRQAPYIEAGGKADAVDGYVPVLVTQDDFLGLFRQHIERLGPEGAVTDEGLEEEYDSDEDKYEQLLRRRKAIEELAATLDDEKEPAGQEYHGEKMDQDEDTVSEHMDRHEGSSQVAGLDVDIEEDNFDLPEETVEEERELTLEELMQELEAATREMQKQNPPEEVKK